MGPFNAVVVWIADDISQRRKALNKANNLFTYAESHYYIICTQIIYCLHWKYPDSCTVSPVPYTPSQPQMPLDARDMIVRWLLPLLTGGLVARVRSQRRRDL